MRMKPMKLATTVMLTTWLGGCFATTTVVQPPTLAEIRRDICGRPMTPEERRAVARELLALPVGTVDETARQLERLNDGARICIRGAP